MSEEQQRLLEIAALLSQDAAKILAGLEDSSQVFMLRVLAVAIGHWEQAGIRMDPIQFDIVVTSIVATIAPIVQTMDATLSLLHTLRKDPSAHT